MNKEQLLEAFSAYLEQTEDQVEVETGEEAEVDLHGLFTEMAGLRSEVKTESRHFKSALDEFHGVFETLQESHNTLKKALEGREDECHQRTHAALRGLLLDVLDIYDRVEAGFSTLNNFKPGFWGCKQQRRFMASIREGQSMILIRMDELLTRCDLHPLETVGQPVDPHTMRVVDTVSDPARESGSVVEELRKGFIWENEVLRLAEVRANKPDE